MSEFRKEVNLREHAPGILALLFFVAACGPDQVPSELLGTPPPPPTRAMDGLLSDPALQRVVDLQIERDGTALVGLLSDPDARIRARAAFALASVQDPTAGGALTPLLRDDDPGVRRDAAFALGQLSEARFGPVLLGALEEEMDPEVRSRLLEALGKVGDQRALERLLALELSGNEEAARALAVARMGVRGVTLPTSIGFLMSSLSSPDTSVRVNAAYYFGRTPAPGDWMGRAEALRGVLDSLPPSDPAAAHLLRGLGRLGDPPDNPRVVWWLRNSPDWRTRANAAEAAAGRAGDPRVRAALLDALDEPSTHVAVNAANALSSTRELLPREIDELKGWIDAHPDEWRRAGPILALLGRMGQTDFLQSWLARWDPEEVAPRTRGLGALAFAPGDAPTQILLEATGSAYSRIRGTAFGGLARRWRIERQNPGRHAVYYEAFSAGLRSGDPAETFVVAPALADSAFFPLGSLGLLEAEYRKLAAPDDLEMMVAILGALGQTGAAEVEPLLMEASRHPTPSIRAAALGALSALRGEEVMAEGGPGEPERRVNWEALAGLGVRPRLIVETEKGPFTIVLDTESAPLTVQTIAGFAAEGLFDDTPFHRVVPNFVVQGGDFARQDGFGGPGFAIRSEFTQMPYLRGVVGMASSGKDTEGSQFFVTHSPQPHLDGGYTAFGWVESGMDVLDTLFEEDRVLTLRVEPGEG